MEKKKLVMILAPALAVIFVVIAFVTVSRDRNRFGEESETKIVTKDEIEVTEVVESEQTSENGGTNEPAKLSELFKPEVEGDSNRVYKEANIIVSVFFCIIFCGIVIYIVYSIILIIYYSISLVAPKKILNEIVELIQHKKIDLEKKE